MNEAQTILLVDDSQDDLLIAGNAFKAARFTASLRTVNNGEEAVAYLKGVGAYSDRNKFPMPSVMLLDLNMRKMNGFSVLMWIRTQPSLKRLSIIIFTASQRQEDVERAFDLGANYYLVKPATMAVLIAMVRTLRDWLEYNHFPSINPMPPPKPVASSRHYSSRPPTPPPKSPKARSPLR